MIDFRFLMLSCVLAASAACVTSSGDNVGPGSTGTTLASNTGDTTEPAPDGETAVVMEEKAVVGRSSSGEKVYCRRRAPIGSRLPVTKCVTEEQRRKQEEYAKEIFKGQDRKR